MSKMINSNVMSSHFNLMTLATFTTVATLTVIINPVDAQDDMLLGIKRSSHGNAALFRKIVVNKKLHTTPITGYSNCSARDCGKYCVYKVPCESFNIKMSTKTCELLSVDRNSKADNITFVNATGWAYYDTGFDIRHPNWRNKYLYNISCSTNKCDKCTCIQPPEEKTHRCVCYSKEGLIKLAVGNWCWYASSSCSASNGDKIVIKPCDKNDAGQQFMYDGQRDVFHKCSQKRVCFVDGIVVLTETCSQPWYMTEQYGLKPINDFCPYPIGGLLESNVGLELGTDNCGHGKGIHRFLNGVDGKIQVKLFRNIYSLDGLSSSPNFPNNPDIMAWFHHFFTPTLPYAEDFFGRQLKTIFVPPQTGSYIFYIQVDDLARLYITYPDTKRKLLITITSHITTTQKMASQALIAFEKYSIEALMWEKKERDFIKVGVEFPDGKVDYPLTETYLLPPN